MSAQGATAPGRPPCRAILEAVSRAGAYNKERGTIDAVPMTAGDKPYFEALYREFHPRVLRYLARLIGFDEAEDAAQEVFAKISRALPEFRNESQVPTWIYRIATNTATDRVRTPEYRLKVRSPPIEGSCEAEPAAVPIASTECSAERQTIRDEMSGCVQGLLAELPDDYRTVLVLSEMEHLKDREIAEGSNAASIATARTRWFATSSRSLQNPDLPDSIFSCAFLVPTAKQEIPCR